MADAGWQQAHWSQRPLCRRYAWALVDSLLVPVRHSDGVVERRFHWALGWLADGECEGLGAWTPYEQDNDSLRWWFADLQARGVERLSNWACPGTGQGRGRVPLPAMLEAEQVRARLHRAVRRRGGFESASAVLDFIADALQRAERRLDRERLIAKGLPRLDSGAQTAPAGPLKTQ